MRSSRLFGQDAYVMRARMATTATIAAIQMGFMTAPWLLACLDSRAGWGMTLLPSTSCRPAKAGDTKSLGPAWVRVPAWGTRLPAMEFLFEILFELIGEVVIQGLVQAGWVGSCEAGSDAFGFSNEPLARHWAGLTLTMLVTAGFGVWRGFAVGSLGWDWWTAAAIAVVAAGATAFRLSNPAGVKPERWSTLTWWPKGRCAWFALANTSCAVAYAVAALS
jgi:hypothetical protein